MTTSQCENKDRQASESHHSGHRGVTWLRSPEAALRAECWVTHGLAASAQLYRWCSCLVVWDSECGILYASNKKAPMCLDRWERLASL